MSRFPRPFALVVAVVLTVAQATQSSAQTLSLDVSSNRDFFYPGDRLELTVAAENQPGPGVADFYTGVILPDGQTVATIGATGAAHLGTLANPGAFLPVATNVGLGGPFSASVDPLFNYVWNGTEPVGAYTIFLAAVRAGGFRDNRIDGDDILAVRFGTLHVRRPAAVTPDGPPGATAVTVDEGGTVTATSGAGAAYALAIPAGALVTDQTITATPVTATGIPVDRVLGMVRFGPDGLQLREPATLTVTLPSAILPVGIVGFRTRDDGAGFDVVPVTINGNTATMMVSHFSTAGVGVSRCGPSVTTPVGRNACARMADALRRAAEIIIDNNNQTPLPTRILLASEIIDALRTWINAFIYPTLRDARDRTDLSTITHVRTMQALREFSAVQAVVELTEALGTGLSLEEELSAVQQVLPEAIAARRSAANEECRANKRVASTYIRRILELTGEAVARGLPVSSRNRGIECLLIQVEVTLPQDIPSGGAPLRVHARLVHADDRSLPSDPQLGSVVVTVEAVARSLIAIASPTLAVGQIATTLDTTVRPTSAVGTMRIEIRSDVPTLGLSNIRTETRLRGNPSWTFDTLTHTLRTRLVAGGQTVTDQRSGGNIAVPDRTHSNAGGTASNRDVEAVMTVSPPSSSTLRLSVIGTAEVLAGPLGLASAGASSEVRARLRLDADFMCSLDVVFESTADPTQTIPTMSARASRQGFPTVLNLGGTGRQAPRLCVAGVYDIFITTGVNSASNLANVAYDARMTFEPVASARQETVDRREEGGGRK